MLHRKALRQLITWGLLYGFPHAIFGQAQMVVQRHSQTEPRAVAVSNDSERAVIIRGDEFGHSYGYELVRTANGRLMASGSMPDFNLLGHGYGLSPSLKKLIYCGRSVPAQILHLQEDKKVFTLKPKDENFCRGAVVTDEGRALLFYDDYIEVYEHASGGEYALAAKHNLAVSGWQGLTAISPDGSLFAVSNYDGKLSVFDTKTLRPVFSKGSSFLFFGTHSRHLQYLQFSPDGKYLVSRDHANNLFVHTLTGDKVAKAKINDDVLLFTPTTDGLTDQCMDSPRITVGKKTFLFCPPSGINMHFDPKDTGRQTTGISEWAKNFRVEQYLRPEFVASADAKSLVLVTSPKSNSTITVPLSNIGLDPKESVRARSNDGVHFVLKQDTKPDPGWCCAYNYFSVKVVGSTATLLGKHRISLTVGDFAPLADGHFGYSVANSIAFVTPKGERRGGTEVSSGDNMHYHLLDYNPAAQMVIGAIRNRIVLWNSQGKVVAEGGESAPIRQLRMSVKGDMFITAAEDGTIGIWQTNTLSKLLTFLQTENGWVAAAADGRYEYKGTARDLLHYVVGDETISLSDFDNSFVRKNLVADILSGKPQKAVLPPETATPKKQATLDISKKLKGKIHSISRGEVLLGGSGFTMGERVFAIVNGKPVRLKVHFPTHTGAKCKPDKPAELRVLRAGMPVFR